jgi:hypothetical protein
MLEESEYPNFAAHICSTGGIYQAKFAESSAGQEFGGTVGESVWLLFGKKRIIEVSRLTECNPPLAFRKS